MDLAGESAAKRGINSALAEEMNIKIIVLPFGKDPDECIKNNSADWFSALKDAKSILQYYFEQTFAAVDLKAAEGKKQAAQILLPIIGQIGNKIEQIHWLQKLAEAINVSEQILRSMLPKVSRPHLADQLDPSLTMNQNRNLMLQQRILAIALKYPTHLPYLIDHLSPPVISDQALKNLYKELIIYYTEDINGQIIDFNYHHFHLKLQKDNLAVLADQLILLAEKDFFDFDLGLVREELMKAVNFAKKNYYNFQLKELENKIKVAETNDQKRELESLVGEFNEILGQRKLLDQ
jgi:DNA primase